MKLKGHPRFPLSNDEASLLSPVGGGGRGFPSPADPEEKELERLRHLVREKGGVDLGLYGESYLKRRLTLLVRSRGCATLGEYVKLLSTDPREIDLFLNSFILRVTEFFRSSSTYEALEMRVLPALFARKRQEFSHVMRCWSAGCSSGEEPYSLAIVIREALKKEEERFSILIFATDIDEKSVMEGRKGLFHPAKLKKVKQEWKERYFQREGEAFAVREEIRRMVVFRGHNLQDPPPFRGLDLILFRNVLIYLKSELQRALLESFFEILNPGGYLVLGRTEGGAGVVPPQYSLSDAAERIYQRPLGE